MKSVLVLVLLFVGMATAVKRADPLKLPLVHRAASCVGLKGENAGATTGADGDALLFNLAFGTPPQPFTVSVESGEVWSWVLDVTNDQVGSGQHTYDHTKSSTSKRGPDELFCNAYGYDVGCRFWYDQVNITAGGTSFSWNQTFGSAMDVYADYEEAQFPTDGVLGLSWTLDAAQEFNQRSQATNDDQTDPSETLILNLLTNFDQHVFTVWLGARPQPGQSASNGQLTIGGIDSTNCDATFSYAPINLSDDGQMIDIQGFQVGNFETRRRRSAQVDTGFTGLVLDPQAYDAVYSVVNPDYSWDDHILTVDCRVIPSLPDLHFLIGDGNFSVSADNYVVDVGLADNKCLYAVSLNDDYGGAHYQLGLPFLREKCVVYDVDQQWMGFTKGNKQ